METRGITSNSFTYKGIVRVSILKNGKKKSFVLPNTGTAILGDILSRSLIRDSLYKVYDVEKPYKVGFVANGNAGVGLRLLSRDVPFSGIVFGEAVQVPSNIGVDEATIIGKLKLTAVITGDATQTQYSGLTGFQLCVMNQNNDVLAYIEDDEYNTLKNIYDALKTQDVLIEWFMLFVNV